jgi:hypothetical protein
MNPRRAGCGESRTSGSEGGPRKRAGREAGTAGPTLHRAPHPRSRGRCRVAEVLA